MAERMMRVILQVPESKAGSLLLDLERHNVPLIFNEAKKGDPVDGYLPRAKGGNGDVSNSDTIFNLIKQSGPMKARDIREALNLRVTQVNYSLTKLGAMGRIEKLPGNRWQATDKPQTLVAEEIPTKKKASNKEEGARQLQPGEGGSLRKEILQALAKQPEGSTPAQLGATLNYASPTISYQGRVLESKGHLKRANGKWYITPKGSKSLSKGV